MLSPIVEVEDDVDAAKADEISETEAEKAGSSETSEEKTNTAVKVQDGLFLFYLRL